MVPGDGVHQPILEDCQPVTQANGDIAPEVLPRFQKQAVVPLDRVLRRQGRQGAVDLLDAFVCHDLVHIPQPPLLNGQQVPAGVLQVADIVDEGHEQVQLRPAPEIVRLPGAGGVLDDGVGYGLHQMGLRIQGVEAVPAVRMGHVQEVDRFDIVALFRKIWPQFFKKLPLWICYVHRLPPLCAAYKEGNDETPGFPAAGRADAEQIVVVAGDHAVGGIDSVRPVNLGLSCHVSPPSMLYSAPGTGFSAIVVVVQRAMVGAAGMVCGALEIVISA